MSDDKITIELSRDDLFDAAMLWVGRKYPELAGVRSGCSLVVDCDPTTGGIVAIRANLGPLVPAGEGGK